MTQEQQPQRDHILWTPEEVKDLVALVSARATIPKIAATLGKTEKSIRRKCERLGLSSSTQYVRHKKIINSPASSGTTTPAVKPPLNSK